MRTVFALMALMACSLSGCLPKNAFAPPPETYTRWSKPGADNVAIWRSMLECNYASPFDGVRGIEGGDRTFDQTVATMICMEGLGFSYSEGGRVLRVCQKYRQNISCQPGADVPEPSSARRMASGYCKKFPQARACSP